MNRFPPRILGRVQWSLLKGMLYNDDQANLPDASINGGNMPLLGLNENRDLYNKTPLDIGIDIKQKIALWPLSRRGDLPCRGRFP